jgi:hypothetical protein
MEAEPVDDMPNGRGWLKPKCNGFRPSHFATATTFGLQSKKRESLNRLFSEVVAASLRGRKIEAT